MFFTGNIRSNINVKGLGRSKTGFSTSSYEKVLKSLKNHFPHWLLTSSHCTLKQQYPELMFIKDKMDLHLYHIVHYIYLYIIYI